MSKNKKERLQKYAEKRSREEGLNNPTFEVCYKNTGWTGRWFGYPTEYNLGKNYDEALQSISSMIDDMVEMKGYDLV